MSMLFYTPKNQDEEEEQMKDLSDDKSLLWLSLMFGIGAALIIGLSYLIK